MEEIFKDKGLEQKIERFILVPSNGGRFEFSVNGELLFSRLKTKERVYVDPLIKLLRDYLSGN